MILSIILVVGNVLLVIVLWNRPIVRIAMPLSFFVEVRKGQGEWIALTVYDRLTIHEVLNLCTSPDWEYRARRVSGQARIEAIERCANECNLLRS